MANSSEYSRTPLAKKLGIKHGYHIVLINQPEYYWKLFDLLPDDIQVIESPKPESIDFIHLFCKTHQGLLKNAKYCKSLFKKKRDILGELAKRQLSNTYRFKKRTRSRPFA